MFLLLGLWREFLKIFLLSFYLFLLCLGLSVRLSLPIFHSSMSFSSSFLSAYLSLSWCLTLSFFPLSRSLSLSLFLSECLDVLLIFFIFLRRLDPEEEGERGQISRRGHKNSIFTLGSSSEFFQVLRKPMIGQNFPHLSSGLASRYGRFRVYFFINFLHIPSFFLLICTSSWFQFQTIKLNCKLKSLQ